MNSERLRSTGKSIGIPRIANTLTSVMAIKSIVALLLGLVIQLSQVQPCWASAPTKSCVNDSPSTCCCGDVQSCPCVSESNPDHNPGPSIPAAVDLKLLISKLPEPNAPTALILPPTNDVRPTTPLIERQGGYAGVPLSVAFCSFVI